MVRLLQPKNIENEWIVIAFVHYNARLHRVICGEYIVVICPDIDQQGHSVLNRYLQIEAYF